MRGSAEAPPGRDRIGAGPVAPRRRSYTPAFAGATIFVLIAVLGIWYVARTRLPPPVPAVAPPPPALARLARGVNLSNWLQHGPVKEAVRYAPDSGDWQRIRALGLTHVRLPVDPAALLDERGLPKPEALAQLRAAVEDAVRENLLVVLVLQLPTELKPGLAAREPDRAALAGTWRWLAGALRDLPPAQLAFEPLNEPGGTDALAARALIEYLASALRAAAPLHTLIVAGHGYSGIDELEALRPLADPNLVYSFHFYEPHNFTHQGANWGDPAWRTLHNFPYPSSPESVAARVGAVPPKARELLRWHGEQRWNREHLGALLQRAAQWGRNNKVPVQCSEFGVFRKRVAPADRAAWLRDVREALEARGIGWTHWDYAGEFGIVGGKQGKRVVDRKAIEALGLKNG